MDCFDLFTRHHNKIRDCTEGTRPLTCSFALPYIATISNNYLTITEGIIHHEAIIVIIEKGGKAHA